MPIIPWLEKSVGGTPNISNDIRQVGFDSQKTSATGSALSSEGVNGIRSLGDAYQQMLSSGGSVLPGSVQSAFSRARGIITSKNARDIAGTSARLKQARVAGNGRLTDAAVQEYMTQGETAANQAAQEADVSLGAQQAELELKETNTLRDRLASAREAILGAGQFQQKLGQEGRLGSLGLTLTRQKGIADAISRFF